MRPIRQTTFPPNGNCFAACIASLLELDIERGPNFAHLQEATGPFSTVRAANNWLQQFGFSILEVERPELGNLYFEFVENALLICSGPTMRGTHHAVIYRGNKLAHDPHPSGAGLERIDKAWLVFRNEPTPAEAPK